MEAREVLGGLRGQRVSKDEQETRADAKGRLREGCT